MSIRDYLEEKGVELPEEPKKVDESDAPTNTTGGVAQPDAQPVMKMTRFAGYPCVEVDDDTYVKCSRGKKPYARWKKYVSDDAIRDEVKKMFRRNQRVMLKSSSTGAMSFLK